ncbi:MAG: isoleucyl-tRNA synthetase, partial [Gaiellales bacterium]|nr:isoleucyl-tRNA synthetase [Gaiellales bacterium]
HKSWGNAIWFDDAIDRIGADVSRWMFAGQDTSQNMNFGYGPATEVARRLLTLWNTYRFLVLNANPEGFRPVWDVADRGPESDNALDRWVIARASELARDCRAALDRYDTPGMTRAVEAFWDDLSNWYVRRSRPRFWSGDRVAFATLHHALVQCLRSMAPVTPFLTEDMWENLVVRGCGADAPASVHLAGYPEPSEAHIARGLLGPMADVRVVCELGNRARAEAKLRTRQPLASAVVACAEADRLEALIAFGDEIASELNVKAVTTTTDLESLVEQQVVPNFRALGPRLGAKVQEVRAALASGAYELGDDGVVHVAGEQLAPGEYELRSRSREGYEAQTDGKLVVAIDTRVSEELALEGTARDVVRFLQNVRKELGFDVSDRIAVSFAADARGAAVIAAHGAWIAGEVLAQRFEPNGGGDHRFASGGAEIAFAVERA